MEAKFLAGDETHKNKLCSGQLKCLQGGTGNSSEFSSVKGALLRSWNPTPDVNIYFKRLVEMFRCRR